MQEKLTIKKKKTGNEYLLTEDGLWVRNLCKKSVPTIDVNDLISINDYHHILENEIENRKQRYTVMDPDGDTRKKVIIISDGYDFENKHLSLSNLPSDVCVIATNKALLKWKLVGNNCPEKQKRAISYYVVNNPYSESLSFLPKTTMYYPKCVASNRTHPAFLKSYKGSIFTYNSVSNEKYSGITHKGNLWLDDYRNPICAATSLAYHLGARKIVLFCCDDSFGQNRPGAINLSNNLWTYPQHEISHRLIDANLHWLIQQGIEIRNYSSGSKFKNAEYINQEDIISFFD